MEAPVRLRAVVKTFGGGAAAVHAVRGVNLDLGGGELFMLIGPSGCGKTTLISIIAGILAHDAGEVALFGERLERLSASAKADFRARRVGFVFQQYNLVPTLTARENVALALQIAGRPRRRALAAADDALAMVGIDRPDALPGVLSGGQQQRVAIARAIVHGPDILVCDEPTSSLDHERGRQVMELLRAVAVAPGRVLIVVSHDQRAYRFADRIATMEDGHLVRFVRRRFDPAAAPEPAEAT